MTWPVGCRTDADRVETICANAYDESFCLEKFDALIVRTERHLTVPVFERISQDLRLRMAVDFDFSGGRRVALDFYKRRRRVRCRARTINLRRV